MSGQSKADNRLRLGPDAGVIASAGPGPRVGSGLRSGLRVGDVASACVRTPLAFVRHLTAELARGAPELAKDVRAVGRLVRSVADSGAVGPEFALQVWISGTPRTGYRASELHRRLAADLVAAGYPVARAGMARILSCCVSDAGVSVGANLRRDSLCDWPGGRVRLSRGPDQASRAEFKLEELFQLIDLRLPERGLVLDLGGSPGGWARIIRAAGPPADGHRGPQPPSGRARYRHAQARPPDAAGDGGAVPADSARRLRRRVRPPALPQPQRDHCGRAPRLSGVFLSIEWDIANDGRGGLIS
jgi:hypothetical protein